MIALIKSTFVLPSLATAILLCTFFLPQKSACIISRFATKLIPTLPTTPGKANLTEFCKRKTPQSAKITTLPKSYSVLPDTSYLSSFLTSAISFAVAVTIRMPLSLMLSSSASSCSRLVSFPTGLSKRNWSTDIL